MEALKSTAGVPSESENIRTNKCPSVGELGSKRGPNQTNWGLMCEKVKFQRNPAGGAPGEQPILRRW